MYILTDNFGRVSVCYDGCAPADAVEVDEPEGWNWENIGDWVLEDGALVHDPLPTDPDAGGEKVPTPVEQLAAENVLLRAQVQALSERGEFIEDCLAEMAMVVYGGA